MQRQNFALTIGFAVTLLAGCGGGGGGGGSSIDTKGADTPATLTAPSDGAKAAQALMGLPSALAVAIPQQSTKSASTAKSTQQNCPVSGNVVFSPNDATAYTLDGVAQFFACVSSTNKGDVTLNGPVNDICNVSVDSSHCANLAGALGDSGTPFSAELKSASADSIVRLDSSFLTALTQSSATLGLNGVGQVENLLVPKSIEFLFDSLQFAVADNGGGTQAITPSGAYGLSDAARTTANCISGKLTVNTVTAVTTDANGTFVGGELHLTGAGSVIADVVYNADSSIEVKINDGAPVNFTAAQLAAFCSIN